VNAIERPDQRYIEKLRRALDRMGGLYTVNDLLERIADGRMQAFVEGKSILVTEINLFPRARTLDCIVVAGDLADCRALHARAMRFAAEIGADVVRAIGRRGWLADATKHGWRPLTTSILYVKDMP
jgi:hypothetical protein